MQVRDVSIYSTLHLSTGSAVHNVRITRKSIVHIREWRDAWNCDALIATYFTPHINTPILTNGDAYEFVMHSSNVGHSSHLMFDLMIQ